MELAGRSALVTGGAARVGRSLTRALAGEGARLVVHFHRSRDAAAGLVEQIRRDGGEAVAVGGDLGEVRELDRVAAEAEAAFGGIDLLVNNASVFPPEAWERTDAALWDRTLAVNLRAPFLLARRLAPGMRRRGGGLIVNLADLAGIQAWQGYLAHGVSKAGLIHLTRVLARALAPEVRVNAIAPGTVLPPEDLPPEQREALERRAPLRRIGDPADVVGALLYLVRAEFVTGEVMVVDGGRSIA